MLIPSPSWDRAVWKPGYTQPWYSVRDVDAPVGGHMGYLTCFLRDGDRVFLTYSTTGRGNERVNGSLGKYTTTRAGCRCGSNRLATCPRSWKRLSRRCFMAAVSKNSYPIRGQVAIMIEKLIVQATGPVLSALLLGIGAGMIARMAQERKEKSTLRHELIQQMTEATSSLYEEILRYRRGAEVYDMTKDEKQQYFESLDKQFKRSRIYARVLEERLDAYFDSDITKPWHATIDLLSMMYFISIEYTYAPPPEVVFEKYAGEGHTGLSREDLRTFSTVHKEYKVQLREATQAVRERRFLPDRRRSNNFTRETAPPVEDLLTKRHP